MALKDFLALADDKLHELFSTKKPDPTKARASLVKRLDTAATQFGSPEPSRGKKMWSVNNNVVELTLPVAIGGKSTYFFPAERFPDAIKSLKDAVNAGEADADLLSDGSDTSAAAPKKRRPLTEEQKAEAQRKRAATMAERGIKPGRKAS